MTPSPLALLLLLPIRAYRRFVSPALVARNGTACRFDPTCSAYAEEAIATHGAVRGSWLTVRRISKCHPWGPVGDDPVPARHAHRRSVSRATGRAHAAAAAGQE